MEQSPWEAIVVKKFTVFYGTKVFITAFTRARHWPQSWARWIQATTSHPIYPRSILILFSDLCIGFPSDLFRSGVPNKSLHAFLISHMHATCPVHFKSLAFIILIIFGADRKLSPHYQFTPAPCHFIPLRYKHSPQRPVLRTLNLYSSLNETDQVWLQKQVKL
jgi:hypothetical protein